ncbi:serine/threonine protein kinase [Fictibacillus sp. BK138]|uniref:serine/threonine protein kinase n=1 Tax=Fictibacillus sp. BK138 TaxID=2512121 RepID=UPI0010E4D956|nr:serine/threonine-protein kinase [Fictibacillus sp. BK138]RZT21673.1 serine/threonine-protein kinase [Fictibacillus sp. BK138]
MITEILKGLQRTLFDRPLKPVLLLQGRYRINEVLGMGSYGITYLAQDHLTDTIVVLKQLRTTKAKTESGLRSFKRESEILKAVQHPQVPKLLDEFQNDRGFFITMEWINGDTFEDLIFRDQHTYSENETITIFLELLNIIETFHENGIIHRDLRIPNIIQRNGKLYIIDFGLACFLSDRETADPDDHPEKLRMRAVTVESDLFALGHFALFLLYSTYEPQSKEERSWEEELNISNSLKAVLRKMLQLDDPFHSVADVRTALLQI